MRTLSPWRRAPHRPRDDASCTTFGMIYGRSTCLECRPGQQGERALSSARINLHIELKAQVSPQEYLERRALRDLQSKAPNPVLLTLFRLRLYSLRHCTGSDAPWYLS